MECSLFNIFILTLKKFCFVTWYFKMWIFHSIWFHILCPIEYNVAEILHNAIENLRTGNPINMWL